MRKLFALPLLFSVIVALPTFLVVLNIKLGLFSPEKIKSILAESNTYQVIAGLLRENFVDSTKVNIENGQVLEIINESINEQNIQKIGESTIDQTFLALENPNGPKQIALDVSSLENNLVDSLNQKLNLQGTDQLKKEMLSSNFNYEIPNNFALPVMINLNQYLLYHGLTLLGLIILLFWIPSQKPSSKLMWLGSGLLLSGLILATATVVIYYVGLPNLNRLLLESSIEDIRIKNSLESVVRLILDNQKIFLIIEDVIVCLLGLFAIGLGRGMRESNVDIIPNSN